MQKGKSKKFQSGITILVAAAILLTACSAIDTISSLRKDPILKIHQGMTKEEVVSIAGQPSRSMTLTRKGGSCLEFTTITEKYKERIDHVVILSTAGTVSDVYSKLTCQGYDTDKSIE